MAEKDKNWFARHKVLSVIIVVVIIGGIAGAVGGNKDGTSTNTPATNTQTSTNEKPAETKPKEEKWDVETAYAKLTDGMTKAEVEAALGKTSDNCSETSAEYVGKIETCNYGGVGDNGMIMVQYQNDKMTTKSKTKF